MGFVTVGESESHVVGGASAKNIVVFSGGATKQTTTAMAVSSMAAAMKQLLALWGVVGATRIVTLLLLEMIEGTPAVENKPLAKQISKLLSFFSPDGGARLQEEKATATESRRRKP